MGGEIHVESQFGKGTTFIFSISDYNKPHLKDQSSIFFNTIPEITQNEDSVIEEIQIVSFNREIEPLKKACNCSSVLIVDDNDYNLFSLKQILVLLNESCDQVQFFIFK